MKKVIMLSLVILLLAFIAIGCGTNGNSDAGKTNETNESNATNETNETNESNTKDSGEPKEVTFFHFKVNIESQMQELIDLYNAEHPNVVVKQEAVGGSTDWMALLRTRFAAGSGPEIFVVDGVSQLQVWQEHLADLSDEPWVEKVFPFATSAMTIDGKLYAMPGNTEGYGFIYNKDIFEELNLEVPTTLSELRSVAEKIEQGGYTPFATGFGEWWVIGMHLMNVPFAHQADPDGFVEQLNEGTAEISGNEMFLDFKNLFDLIVEYGGSNPLTNDYNAQVSEFSNGQVAMMQQGNWMEPTVFDVKPDMNMGLMPIPFNDSPSMDRLLVGVPQNFVVNKNSDSVEESKHFLNWLVTNETAIEYYTDEFAYIPVFDHISADNLGPLSQDIAKYSADDKTLPWVFSKWPDGIYNEFASILQGYVGKQYDYDETLNRMDKAWEELK